MDHFSISSTGLSMNYMPHYLAKELGYFSDAGLEVDSYVPNPWLTALTDIDSGKTHAVEGGIWVPLIYLDRIKNYKAFAKIASRCPFAVVSRKPVENFSWQILEGKTVLIPGGDGASPSLFTTGCAREAGVDISKIRFVHNFAAHMLIQLFKGGMGDIIVLQPDLASQLATAGDGHIIADMTVWGGSVPWSVYYSTPEFLEQPGNLAGRFTLALQRATTWLLEHDGADCQEIIQRNWPKIDLQAGIDVINLFRKEGMWTQSVAVDQQSLDRWQNFLLQGNVIDHMIPYDRVVDSRPYEYAVRQLSISAKSDC